MTAFSLCPPFRVRSSVTIGFVLAASASVFAAPPPGSLLEVEVETDQGPATARFVYCPAGEVLHGKPRPLPERTGNKAKDSLLRKSRVAALRGFYILESEVSQKQYRQMVGAGSVDRVFQRLAEADRTAIGDDYPIRGITLFEASEFCSRFNKLDAANPRVASSLEARRVRLPTHYEWQYACRAIADPDKAFEKPHFNAWPSLEVIDQAVLADCRDHWKKGGETEEFTGSQEQVEKLLQYLDAEPATAIKVLDAFLQAGLGTARSYENVRTPLQPIRTGNPNDWGIFNMHDNVVEWTIAENDHTVLATLIAKLEAGDRESLDRDDPRVFVLAGGGYNFSLARNPAEWVRFSIWGDERVNPETGEPNPYKFRELEELYADRLAGFRVVLERVLAPTWLYVVRTTALPEDPAELTAIEKQLADIKYVVQALVASSEADLAGARVSYYRALANYRAGRTKDASEILKNQCGALPQEDEYFRHLIELVEADAKPHL